MGENVCGRVAAAGLVGRGGAVGVKIVCRRPNAKNNEMSFPAGKGLGMPKGIDCQRERRIRFWQVANS
jgi:hypothetical protein